MRLDLLADADMTWDVFKALLQGLLSADSRLARVFSNRG